MSISCNVSILLRKVTSSRWLKAIQDFMSSGLEQTLSVSIAWTCDLDDILCFQWTIIHPFFSIFTRWFLILTRKFESVPWRIRTYWHWFSEQDVRKQGSTNSRHHLSLVSHCSWCLIQFHIQSSFGQKKVRAGVRSEHKGVYRQLYFRLQSLYLNRHCKVLLSGASFIIFSQSSHNASLWAMSECTMEDSSSINANIPLFPPFSAVPQLFLQFSKTHWSTQISVCGISHRLVRT